MSYVWLVIIPTCLIVVLYLAVGCWTVWIQRVIADPNVFSSESSGRLHFIGFAWLSRPWLYRLVSVAIVLLWPVYGIMGIALGVSYCAARLYGLVFGLKEWNDYHHPRPEPEPESLKFEHTMAIDRPVVRRRPFGRRQHRTRQK